MADSGTFNTILSNRAAQLAVGLFAAVLFPLFFGVNSGVEFYTSYSTLNSVIGATCCILVGYWMSNRLNAFPGVSTAHYSVLCYSGAFGLLALIFFLLRLDYSRVLLATSFVECIVWFSFVRLKVEGATRLKMALVKRGDVDLLLSDTSVDWSIITEPEDYHPSMGGVVADLRVDFEDKWLKFLTETSLQGIPVYHVKHIREELTGQVSIEHLVENDFGSLLPNLAYLQIKLIIDVLAALILLIPALIILAILAPICLLVQGRPFIFKQQRMGYRGDPFSIYKLRTMVNSESSSVMADINAGLNIDDATEAQELRVTPFGKFLRRTRLDELPQIVNVLKGDMSWIGPRPEALELSDWYENSLGFYRYRHIVRPGISGWAQVSQGHVVELDEVSTKLNFDFFYIKNISIWLDMLIAFRTLTTIITGFGSK